MRGRTGRPRAWLVVSVVMAALGMAVDVGTGPLAPVDGLFAYAGFLDIAMPSLSDASPSGALVSLGPATWPVPVIETAGKVRPPRECAVGTGPSPAATRSDPSPYGTHRVRGLPHPPDLPLALCRLQC